MVVPGVESFAVGAPDCAHQLAGRRSDSVFVTPRRVKVLDLIEAGQDLRAAKILRPANHLAVP